MNLETNEIIAVKVNKKEIAEKKYKLLYVEDDAIALQYVKQVLSKVYEIDTAQNAQLAINLVNENTYDAFLLDINLGHGMDGVELAQILKQNPKNHGIPMVAVTAYASDEDKADFLSKGFTHYISKPFVSRELLDLIKKVLQS